MFQYINSNAEKTNTIQTNDSHFTLITKCNKTSIIWYTNEPNNIWNIKQCDKTSSFKKTWNNQAKIITALFSNSSSSI